MDFIAHVMEEAYEGNVVYDVDDMRNAILLFAASSTNQADICVKTVAKMHFKSKEEAKSETDILEAPIAFFDCEVFRTFSSSTGNWQARISRFIAW